MLVSLRIKNLALVEDLSIEWGKGFNSITGETGAGKSILISALKLTLGERADKDWIRTGTDACTVEAVFETGRLSAVDGLLDELGLEPCQDSQLILKRVFSSAGGNRQFVNGSPATLQALRQIGELLVDMHGPHDHQSLLNRQTQLAILDRFAALEKIASAYRAEFNRRREIEERKAALVMDDREFHRQLDLLSHQVNEIETAALNRDEEERIEQEYKLAASGQKLLDLGGRAQAALSENEDSVIDSLAQVHRALRELSAIDPSVLALEEQSASLNEQLQDLSQTLSRYLAKVDLDPDRLQFLSDRISLIQSLKRKYGQTLAEVLEHGKSARERLSELQGREAELQKLEVESGKVNQALARAGEALRAARGKAIPKLSKLIQQQMKELGFAQSTFKIKMKPCDPAPTGMDEVEYLFAPNPGEPEKPLKEIASSGEMARVMLALKTALADQDAIPVLVFDEVDANVGGEIGERVGEKLSGIGKNHQVLCITHLPQVASQARTHFLVLKKVEKGRTFTLIERLGEQAREKEIARMLGGKAETAVKHARELLKVSC